MKTYDQAPPEVRDRCIALMNKYHPDLLAVALRLDLLMASTDSEDGHAVTHGGYPALAVVRIISSKDRAKDLGDAEIVIDRDAYEAMTSEQRNALLDHELYHIEVVKDSAGQVKRDDHQRPKLKMRKHDVQVGWFLEIARRHGPSSIEVKQATDIYIDAEQLLFGWAKEESLRARIEAATTGKRAPVLMLRTDNEERTIATVDNGADDVIAVRIDGDERVEVSRRDGKFVIEITNGTFRSKSAYDTEAEAMEAFNQGDAA